MKPTGIAFFLGMAATKAIAKPMQESPMAADFTLHGGPASYSMVVIADGTVHTTDNDLSISIIDINDFNAFSQCEFITVNDMTIVPSIDQESGDQSLLVGPPTPITGIKCEGVCGYLGDVCGKNQPGDMQCCNGYCYDDHCVGWDYFL